MTGLADKTVAAQWERIIAVTGAEAGVLDSLRHRLFERDTDLSPPGRISANGSCHLLRAVDGWIALNLARPDDRAALPALFEIEFDASDAAAIARLVQVRTTATLRERAVMLQLPFGVLGEAPPAEPRLVCGRQAASDKVDGLRVLDMSALWAGPLCGGIFAALGARVTKIEDWQRPDTLQTASPVLDMRLNGKKTRRAVDLREELPELVANTDILLTSARPSALARLGLEPAALFERHPSLRWIAITAHGWTGENARRVGFGDDCAVAGGLVDWNGDTPRFCGDAIADPLTGLLAARHALEAVAAGRAGLLDCAMTPAAAFYAERRAR